jgi:hypothetical protein
LSDSLVEDFRSGELEAVLDKLLVTEAKGAGKSDQEDRQG